MKAWNSVVMRRAAAGCVGVVWLTLLASCGGGGGSEPEPGVAGEPYFPLAVGARWRHLEDGALTLTTIKGTQVINGETALVLTTNKGGADEEDYYVKSAAGVSHVVGPNSDPLTRAAGRFDAVRFPLRAGSSYVALDKSIGALFDMDGDGRLDPATLKVEVAVVGFERVSAPVGAFDNALHLRTVLTYTFTLSASARAGVFVTTIDEWHVADVGPVRGNYRNTSNGAAASGYDAELLAYRVGSRSGNSGGPPPTVLSVSPASPEVVGPLADITLRFSDAMDPATLPAGGVVVRGADGVAISGQASWTDERSLRFRPTNPLIHGPASVSLARGAADWFGQAVASDTLVNFQVDARAPAVAELSPLPDSLSSTAQITVRFDEPTQQASAAVALALAVTGPSGAVVNGNLRWVDERTLAFEPAGALASGSYIATLGAGAADRVGNVATAGTQWRFAIDANGPTLVSLSPLNGGVEAPVVGEIRATFDEPVAAASVTAGSARLLRNGQAVAATARIEGNAVVITPLQALLYGVTYEARFENGLTDRLGNPLQQAISTRFLTDTGRFALPVLVPALAQEPEASLGLVLADLDGNQTQDLVVGADSTTASGLAGRTLVVPRNADSTLAATAIEIPSLGCYPLSAAVGDFNGDGRNDLAVSEYFCGVEWMNRNASGTWVRQGRIATTQQGARDLQVLALAGSAGPGLVFVDAGSLVLLRPASGGGFAAAETVPIGSAQVSRMVVADINNDGRPDLVAVGTVGLNPGIIIVRQNADASFTVETRVMPTASSVLAVGDIDGDGRQDVIVGDTSMGPGLALLLQSATGTLANPMVLALPLAPRYVRVLDFNGDGRMDIVVSHDSAVSGAVSFTVATQRPGGGFDVGNPFDFGDPLLINSAYPFMVADFTGDGRLDFMIGRYLIRQKPSSAAPASVSAARSQRLRFGLRAGSAAKGLGLGR